MFRLRISKADKLFSNYIRLRDSYTCVRCHTYYLPPTKAIHNSHYWGRKNKGTRFDPENCDALCYGCHRLWGEDKDSYREFKIKQLGQERFDALERRAKTPTKVDESLIVLWCNSEIIKLETGGLS